MEYASERAWLLALHHGLFIPRTNDPRGSMNLGIFTSSWPIFWGRWIHLADDYTWKSIARERRKFKPQSEVRSALIKSSRALITSELSRCRRPIYSECCLSAEELQPAGKKGAFRTFFFSFLPLLPPPSSPFFFCHSCLRAPVMVKVGPLERKVPFVPPDT